MLKSVLGLVFSIFVVGSVHAQLRSFEIGSAFSSGWISNAMGTEESRVWTGGVFGSWRFSKHFGLESGINYTRVNGSAANLIGYSPSALKSRGTLSASFFEMPVLMRIYIVQRDKSPWEVNIDGGYSAMYRSSELPEPSESFTHNLLLGVGVQRMITGPFFLGILLRTSWMSISQKSDFGLQQWAVGLRAGMKLNTK